MKRKLMVIAAILVCVMTMAVVFSSAAASADPADSYVVQTAANEDSSISMWFEHSFKKVMTSDTTPSGMDTYSIYMAKNEIESAQVILLPSEAKYGITASVTPFTDGKGNTIEAEVYYQAYVTLSDLATTVHLGATAENTFIRNGEQPELCYPVDAASYKSPTTNKTVKGYFSLNAGKTQALYIRAKSTSDTPSGWYSAQFNVTNEAGEILKTATVYAYVWDFEISEKTELQTAFYMENTEAKYASGTYKEYYDYLLENRLMAMDIPGNFTSENEYLTNDRVSAIRVSPGVTGTGVNAYLNPEAMFATYGDIYEDISGMKEWEDIKDKFYFYLVDEAMSQEHQDDEGKGGATVNDVKSRWEKLSKYWPNAGVALPYHENHPYPYYTFGTQTIASLSTDQYKDGLQEMIDTATTTIWCPQIYAFTNQATLTANGYDGSFTNVGVRSLSGTISGNKRANEGYFNWEALYGEFADRVISNNIVRNEDENNNDRLWTYSAGWNKSYTYCNHLIESSGIQTKLLFWQLYQNDITGYLYYGTNNWTEYDDQNGKFIDKTTTGSIPVALKTNKHVYGATPGEPAHAIYGNGVLFYATSMARINTSYNVAGSIRVEMLRDGVEEYQMLTMLEDLKGSEAADAVVNTVSSDISCYLSLAGFNKSAEYANMNDYDVLAAVRKSLGNQIEAAMDDVCNHTYDDGKITREPTCLVMGEKVYSCTKCDAKVVENVPTLHAQGDCFKLTGGTSATCTEDGREIYTCDICGYSKYIDVKANHSNPEKLNYKSVSELVHEITCKVCGLTVDTVGHDLTIAYTNTCTEAGTINDVCRYCDYYVEGEAIEAKGHFYRDGVCVTCGENDPDAPVEPEEPEYVTGDLSGEGAVNISDLFALKGYLAGTTELDETAILAADCNGDGKVNISDFFSLKKYLASGEF